MKKTKTRNGKQSAKKKPVARRGAGRPVDLESIRREISELVGTEAMGMVETTIAEADKGHYGAMKYLFEMVGLYPATEGEVAPGDDSLAKTLLRRIGVPEDEVSEQGVTKEFTATGAQAASGEDAVK